MGSPTLGGTRKHRLTKKLYVAFRCQMAHPYEMAGTSCLLETRYLPILTLQTYLSYYIILIKCAGK